MFKLLTFILVISFICPHAYAQENDVEINLDALQDYTPPPMFDAEPEALTPLPATPPASVEIIKTVVTPIPQRKPPFTGTLKKQEIDIKEDQIVLQTAKDILRQIEGESLESIIEQEVTPPPAPIKEVIKKPVVKKAEPLALTKPFEVSLPYETAETELSEEQKNILLQQILIRLQKYEEARLEVKAYASSDVVEESPTRRLSLERALEIRNFLISRGVGEEKIYLRALGASEQNNADYVQLTISRL